MGAGGVEGGRESELFGPSKKKKLKKKGRRVDSGYFLSEEKEKGSKETLVARVRKWGRWCVSLKKKGKPEYEPDYRIGLRDGAF